LLIQNFISMPAPVFRRDFAQAVGGLDESLWYTADWDFWLKLAAATSIAYIEAPLSGFRIHTTSQTTRRSVHTNDFRNQLETVFHRHFQTWDAHPEVKKKVEKAGRFSIEVNTALAAWTHGFLPPWKDLLHHFARLGPSCWDHYFQDSRIVERMAARLRAGLAGRKGIWASPTNLIGA
jgi:hypothetical protein